MEKAEWEFYEDGSCDLSQYDRYELKTNIVILRREHLDQFLADAKEHASRVSQ